MKTKLLRKLRKDFDIFIIDDHALICKDKKVIEKVSLMYTLGFDKYTHIRKFIHTYYKLKTPLYLKGYRIAQRKGIKL